MIKASLVLAGIASITHAAQLSKAPPSLSEEQKDILYDLFEDNKGEDGRLVFLEKNKVGFVNLMYQHGVETDEHWNTCSPNTCPESCFSLPLLTNAIRIAKDYTNGWCYHYNAPGVNEDGKLPGFSYSQFLAALKSAWNDDKDVYTKLTEDYIDDYRLKSLDFEYILKFESRGGGGTGRASKTVTFEVGRSQEREIARSTMKKIDASVEIEGVSISAEYQRDFSDVQSWAEYTRYEETESYDLDLGVSNYVYQKMVTMEYYSGRTETIGMGKLITSEPENFSKSITYHKNGSIKSTTFSFK